MKKSKFTESQIVVILKADAGINKPDKKLATKRRPFHCDMRRSFDGLHAVSSPVNETFQK
jgi:hypothetical protein